MTNELFSKKIDEIIQLYSHHQLDEAIKKAEQLYLTTRPALEKNEPDFIHVLDILGDLYKIDKRYAASASLFLKALDIRERLQDNTTIIETLKKVYGVYRAAAAYKNALPFLQRALEMEEAEWGGFHPTYVKTLTEAAYLHYLMKNYGEAAQFCVKAMQIRKIFPGEAHPDYAESLAALETVYRAERKYTDAISVQQELLHITRTYAIKDKPKLSSVFNELGNLYYYAGEFRLALPAYQESLNLQRSLDVQNFQTLAAAYQNLANTYRELKMFHEAVALYREGLDIRFSIIKERNADLYLNIEDLSKLIQMELYNPVALQLYEHIVEAYENNFDKEDLNYAALLKNLAAIYEKAFRYREAVSRLEESISIQKNHHGEEARLTSALLLLAKLYLETDNLIGAEEIYKTIIDTNAQIHQPSIEIGAALSGLGSVYIKKGLYDLAEDMCTQALAIAEALKTEHPGEYITSLGNLANVKGEKYDFSAAEALLREALEYQQSLTGINSPQSGAIKCRLGNLLREGGDYTRAIQLFHEGIELLTLRIDEFAYSLAEAKSNLALAYIEASNYTAAQKNLDESEKALTKIYGPHSLVAAAVLDIRAGLEGDLGDFVTAERTLKKSLAIKDVVLGPDSKSAVNTLNNLAMTYLNSGDRGKAQTIMERCIKLIPRFESVYPETAANLFNTYASLYSQIGAFETAEHLFRKAISISTQLFGVKHRRTANYLCNLALLYEIKNELPNAISLYKEALATSVEIFGAEHPDVLRIQLALINLHAATGDPFKAMEVAKSVQLLHSRLSKHVVSVGSSRAKQRFVANLQQALNNFISLVVTFFPDSVEKVSWLYEVVINSKRFATEVYSNAYSAYEERYPLLKPLLEELQAVRTQKANLLLNGPVQGTTKSSFRQTIENLQERQIYLEKELAWEIPELKKELQLNEIDFHSIVSVLPTDHVLVEYVKFNLVDYNKVVQGHFDNRSRYLAFVLNAGTTPIALVDLGNAEVIESLIADFREGVTGEKELPAQLPAFEEKNVRDLDEYNLAELIFSPLEHEIGSKSSLIIVADGEINRVSFDALSTSAGKFIIDDYCIGYLSSAHDIMRLSQNPSVNAGEALVIADPDYGLLDEAIMRHDYEPLDQLPGTRLEGERISALLNVKPFLGDKATVSCLRNAQSPKIIHMATHGFFLQSNTPTRHKNVYDFAMMIDVPGEGSYISSLERNTNFSDYTRTASRVNRISNLESPFLRSGLAFSKANYWLFDTPGSSEAADSILLAEHVFTLKLDKTEMVVLSACETGLGEVKVGLGVFGLRYAFMVAGCRSLVMSLWKVADEPTQDLMIEFYKNLISGIGRVEALRRAKLTLKVKYPSPYYWGGFICQGKNEPIRLEKA